MYNWSFFLPRKFSVQPLFIYVPSLSIISFLEHAHRAGHCVYAYSSDRYYTQDLTRYVLFRSIRNIHTVFPEQIKSFVHGDNDSNNHTGIMR